MHPIACSNSVHAMLLLQLPQSGFLVVASQAIAMDKIINAFASWTKPGSQPGCWQFQIDGWINRLNAKPRDTLDKLLQTMQVLKRKGFVFDTRLLESKRLGFSCRGLYRLVCFVHWSQNQKHAHGLTCFELCDHRLIKYLANSSHECAEN